MENRRHGGSRPFPSIIEALLNRWRLRVDAGAVRHGEFALVVPVRRADERYVLKVSQHAEAVASEALALEAWGGRGAAQLFEAEPSLGALLLERLDSSQSLFDVPLWEAAPLAGALLARLATVPAPANIPRLRDLGMQLATSLPERNEALGRPVPTNWLDTAAGLVVDLSRDAGDRLIHADLHYGNILAGAREPWLAVDPRPVAGDPEHAVPELRARQRSARRAIRSARSGVSLMDGSRSSLGPRRVDPITKVAVHFPAQAQPSPFHRPLRCFVIPVALAPHRRRAELAEAIRNGG